jgi:transposase
MNIYLKELANLGDKKAIIIMDGASWHRSVDLVIPENIEIVILPPYSSELNSTEKPWQYIVNL